MPRKTSEDIDARSHAITMHAAASGVDGAVAADAISAFPSAEFETATSKVGGEPVKLRRVVLTGPWEVVNQ
jgi:hypothetical protein